ncbi:MAG: SpoIIE family protein phosphatase [Spirochaetes bacterium]|nr:SpoIIE family protein phosphatase [Spirochaetota bacterium]
MSIKLKFTVLILIFIIILVSVLTVLSISRQKNLLLESTDTRMKVLMLNASDTIKEGMISADDLLISTIIRKIKQRNDDIIHTYLLNKKGELIFHSDTSVMNKILDMGLLKKYEDPLSKKAIQANSFLKQKDKDNYIYSYPIIDNNIKIGTLFLKFSFLNIRKKINMTQIRLITTSLLIMVVFVFITYLFTNILLRPVKKLTEGAKIIGKGDLDHKIIITQHDELGALAESFNTMTEELKISRQKIIDNEVLEKDLQIAKDIQGYLIPQLIPKIKDIQIGKYYNPAHFVGGDYYDIVEISKNKYGIIIIDVAGKGSGAAIIMAVITFIFHSEASKTFDTGKLMGALNNNLIDRIPRERFATGLYMIYDAERGIIQYSNAGHSQIVLYKRSSNKVYELAKATAMPIGISKDVDYPRAGFKFEKGDILMLQTDGIYEAMNSQMEDFGMERVIKSFLKDINKKSPDQINNSIINDIKVHVGDAKQHDDMTLITIKKS